MSAGTAAPADDKVNLCYVRRDMYGADGKPVFCCGGVFHKAENPAFGSECAKSYICRGFDRDSSGSPRCTHARYMTDGSPWFCDNMDMRLATVKAEVAELSDESTHAYVQNRLLRNHEMEPSSWT